MNDMNEVSENHTHHLMQTNYQMKLSYDGNDVASNHTFDVFLGYVWSLTQVINAALC